MPELPEVETIARQLSKHLAKCNLKQITILDKKKLRLPRASCYCGPVVRVFRRAKFLVIEVAGSTPFLIVVHLRMTGRLIWQKHRHSAKTLAKTYYRLSAKAETKHLRASFLFDLGTLSFFDPRRFGTLQIVRSLAELNIPGIEPLTPELNPNWLANAVSGSKQQIKAFLLRPDRISGIGNIYASEILFEAKINPTRRAGSLTSVEIAALCQATRKILSLAIKHCGTTFSDFQDSSGATGSFQRFLKVYDRADLPCRRCQTPIQRQVIQQRSTFYCPVCQRVKPH